MSINSIHCALARISRTWKICSSVPAVHWDNRTFLYWIIPALSSSVCKQKMLCVYVWCTLAHSNWIGIAPAIWPISTFRSTTGTIQWNSRAGGEQYIHIGWMRCAFSLLVVVLSILMTTTVRPCFVDSIICCWYFTHTHTRYIGWETTIYVCLWYACF